MHVMSTPCGEFIGAIGHHAHFTEDEAARRRIAGFCQTIREEGLRAFVEREYPRNAGKAIIVNEAEGAWCLVDGNAHLVSAVVCDPDLTLERLVEETGRPDAVRLWRGGWEDGSGQEGPYDVYIPLEIDTDRLPEWREGIDWFKESHPRIKIIPSDLRFDTPLLSSRDRGRPLAETAAALRDLGVG